MMDDLRSRTVPGMTLIELMATITIMAIILIVALPSFRALQARQDLRVAQRGIQSALYSMQQQALAPPSTNESVVGYGLAFYPTLTSITIDGCPITPPAEFVAIFKFVQDKVTNGNVIPRLRACPKAGETLRDYPSDFYVLPKGVTFRSEWSTPPFTVNTPWLLPAPLGATGNRLGDFATFLAGTPYQDPLASLLPGQQAVLGIEQKTVTLFENGQRRPACYGIVFARDNNAVAITSQLQETCQN